MTRTDGPSAQVLRSREEQAARDEGARARWEEAIETHIAVHRMALDFLDETHQWIADTYNFDLIGDSRPAAMWQMTGRCIGIARLICDALALGYTAEVLHLARALHEADRLADIFALPEGTDLLRKWLADESRMSVCVAMSAAFATIFSFEKSRTWIIRDGFTGISGSGSGAPIASGLKKSRGLRMGARP